MKILALLPVRVMKVAIIVTIIAVFLTLNFIDFIIEDVFMCDKDVK